MTAGGATPTHGLPWPDGAATADGSADIKALAEAAEAELVEHDTAIAGKEATGVAAGLVTAHEAAADPHPGYLTSAEADTAYVNVAGDTMTGYLSFDEDSSQGLIWNTSDRWLALYQGRLGAYVASTGAPTRFAVGNATVATDAMNQLSADNRYVEKTGDTMTGNLTLSAASGSRYLTIDTTNANAGVVFQQAGVDQWMIRKESSENLAFARYDDAGAEIDLAAYLERSSGRIIAGHSPIISGTETMYLRADPTARGSYGQLQVSCGTTGGSGVIRLDDAGDFWFLVAPSYNGAYTAMRPLKISAAGFVYMVENYKLTTTSAANMYFASEARPFRSTSSLRYKHAILGLDGTYPEVVPFDRRMKPAQAARQNGSAPVATDVLNVTPVQFVGDSQNDGLRVRVGAIAEDVAKHAPWALSDSKDSIEWPSVTAALLQIVKDQQVQITQLEARLDALEGAAA